MEDYESYHYAENEIKLAAREKQKTYVMLGKGLCGEDCCQHAQW